MSPKGKYGLYSSWKMLFSDGTGYYVNLACGTPASLGLKSSSGWLIDNTDKEFEGAALVAPLSVLFWEDK